MHEEVETPVEPDTPEAPMPEAEPGSEPAPEEAPEPTEEPAEE